MHVLTDFWAAYTYAALLREMYGGEYEIGYSNGKYTVSRMALPDSALCRDYLRFRETLYAWADA